MGGRKDEISKDDLASIVSLFGDFLQLAGDALAYLAEKTGHDDAASAFTMLSAIGNFFQALGPLIGCDFRPSKELKDFLAVLGGLGQAISGVLEATED